MPRSTPRVLSSVHQLRLPDVALVGAGLVLDLVIWGGDGHTRLGWSVSPAVVLLSAAAAFSVLFFRPRGMLSAYLAVWVYSVWWGALLPTYQPFTGLLIVLYAFARHRPVTVAAAALVGLTPPWIINTYNASLASGLKVSSTSVVATLWSVMAAAVYLAGRYGFRAQRMGELRESKLAAEAALNQQKEQLRLARELHDIVAHSVGAIMFQAAGARTLIDGQDPRVAETLRIIEETSTRASRELRGLLGLLQPAPGHNAAATASLVDVDALLQSTRACSVNVSFREEGARVQLDPVLDHTAYRVLQEALANVIKHGGVGASTDVCLSWQPQALRASVTSHASANGVPTTRGSSSGYGLPGLADRVTEVGGALTAGTAPDGSFLVVAVLPLHRPGTSRSSTPESSSGSS